MAATATEDGGLCFTVASVMQDVLQQHVNGLRDHDLVSRRAEEAGTYLLLLSNFAHLNLIHLIMFDLTIIV